MKRYYQRRTGRTSWCPGWCRPGCWSAGRHRWRCPATACWCWSRGRRTCYRISRRQWSAAGRRLLSGCPGLPSCSMWNPCCQRPSKLIYLSSLLFSSNLITLKPHLFGFDGTILFLDRQNTIPRIFLELHCTRTWNTTTQHRHYFTVAFLQFPPEGV